MTLEKIVDQHHDSIDRLSQTVASLDKSMVLVTEQINCMSSQLDEIRKSLHNVEQLQLESYELLQKVDNMEESIERLIEFKDAVEIRHYDEDFRKNQWRKFAGFVRNYWTILVFCGGLFAVVWGSIESGYHSKITNRYIASAQQKSL